jgi:hypothetical protein
MPLFVDGVEIKSVFVDGVEQSEVWADGVQVFSSVGNYFFDDFNRSPNGTPVSDHIMNTGQSWFTTESFPPNPKIQPFNGVQTAYNFTSFSEDTCRTELIPDNDGSMWLEEAYVFNITGSWDTNNLPFSNRIGVYLTDGISVMECNYQEETLTVRASRYTIWDGVSEVFDAPCVTANGQGGMTVYWDRITGQLQCVATDGGGATYVSTKVAISFVPNQISLVSRRWMGFLPPPQTMEAAIQEVEMTPYLSADLPWPV